MKVAGCSLGLEWLGNKIDVMIKLYANCRISPTFLYLKNWYLILKIVTTNN